FFNTSDMTIYPSNANADVLIGGFSTASATLHFRQTDGQITLGDAEKHTLSNFNGNLRLDSDGTYVHIAPDLLVGGGDILGAQGETRLTLSDSQDTVLVTGLLDVDG